MSQQEGQKASSAKVEAAKSRLFGALQGGLIVSCQARPGSPLYGPQFMAAMAKEAEIGGAVALRVNGPDDIRAVRTITTLPILGIFKIHSPDNPVYITPTFEAARAVVQAGADIVALDGTGRSPDNPEALARLIARIRGELGAPVMADVSTAVEGIAAARAGADLVATTLAGYTEYSRKLQGPDFELIRELAVELAAPGQRIPIVAEGRISTPEEAAEALRCGAFAVVVGRAITMPRTITARFAGAVREAAAAFDGLGGPGRGRRTRAARRIEAGRRDARVNTAWQKAWRIAEAEVGQAYTAVAAALVAKDADGSAHIVDVRAAGQAAVDDDRAVEERTLFDLASLTKVVATTAVILKLYEAGVMELDAPLARYLPAWRPSPASAPVVGGVDGVTVRRLLTHTSGLINAAKAYTACTVAADTAGAREGADAVARVILSATPAFPPGTSVQYTDWGFILLGLAAEAVTGETLDSLAYRLVFAPLGMSGACFRPQSAVLKDRCAAASWEAFAPKPGAASDDVTSWDWRQKYRPAREAGVVHDNTAYALGGVAGHAGLFASVTDLAQFVTAWLGNGQMPRWLRHETAALATSDQTRLTPAAPQEQEQRRGLGWLLNSAASFGGNTFFGRRLTPSAYGHNGFTGTALWIDPGLGIALVLLTNAVHLSRGADTILRVRREFADAAAECSSAR